MKTKRLFAVAVVLFLAAGFVIRLGQLHGKAQRSSSESQLARAFDETEDAKLFRMLLDEKLIDPVCENGRLDMVSSDHVLAKRAERALRTGEVSFDETELDRQEELVEKLYRSKPGQAIRRELEIWNRSLDLAAVRDNRPRPSGETSSLWTAHESGESGEPNWMFPRTGSDVPESLGYVNGNAVISGFGDWLAAYSRSDTSVFRTRVVLEKPFELIVQVIGTGMRFDPPIQEEQISERPDPNWRPDRENGTDAGVRPEPVARTIRIPLSKGAHDLCLAASPAHLNDPAPEGKRIRFDRKTGKFDWVSSPPGGKPREPVPVRIFTADNVLLCDETGVPTRECRELGLSALVGFRSKTRLALFSLLSRGRFPDSRDDAQDVFLTIDSRIQRAALGALEKGMSENAASGEENPDDPRRGAVAAVDPDTGAILAAASLPGLPPDLENVNEWDLVSIPKAYPAANPLYVGAWQGMDRHSAPGSTFKPVVAMAAMDAMADRADRAENEGEIATFLRGFSRSSLERRSGLTLDCKAYAFDEQRCVAPGNDNPPKIHNFKFNGFYSTPGGSYPKNGANGWGDEFGLRQAIRDSINVWFVRLGLLIDGEAARSRRIGEGEKGRDESASPFRLVRAARKFGFGGPPLDLAASPPAGMLPHRLSGDVLFAQTGRLGLEKAAPDMRTKVLAQNAIGQAVFATPLQMALVAAAAKNGSPVSPGLFRDANRGPSKKAHGLDLLREGMKAVPVNGTAKRAFQAVSFKNAVFGKTGTASVGKIEGKTGIEKYNTAWFIGWYDAEKDASISRSVAFACMIDRSNKGGGGAAAPVIADMLQRLAGRGKEKSP